MVRARLTIQTMVLNENVTRARNGVSQSDCTTDRAPLLCPAMPLCLCTDRRARRSPACGGEPARELHASRAVLRLVTASPSPFLSLQRVRLPSRPGPSGKGGRPA